MLVAVYRALRVRSQRHCHYTYSLNGTMNSRYSYNMTKQFVPDFKANQSIISKFFVYVSNDGTKVITILYLQLLYKYTSPVITGSYLNT